jgi:hypothetical protein
VGSHILLEVEVGKLLTLLQLQELEKLGIRVDLTTVVLILELLVADISINLTSNLSASKNASLRLSKEGGEFVGDKSGLHETRRSTVGVGLATLVRLICGTKLTGMLTLKLIDLRADGSKNCLSTLKLSKNTGVKSSANRAIELSNRSRSLSTINGGGGGGGGHTHGSGVGGLGGLGSSRSLGRLGCGRSSGRGGRSSRARNSSRRRSRLDHVIGYTHMSKVFLSCFRTTAYFV